MREASSLVSDLEQVGYFVYLYEVALVRSLGPHACGEEYVVIIVQEAVSYTHLTLPTTPYV